jgi:hypothetical protein
VERLCSFRFLFLKDKYGVSGCCGMLATVDTESIQVDHTI